MGRARAAWGALLKRRGGPQGCVQARRPGGGPRGDSRDSGRRACAGLRGRGWGWGGRCVAFIFRVVLSARSVERLSTRLPKGRTLGSAPWAPAVGRSGADTGYGSPHHPTHTPPYSENQPFVPLPCRGRGRSRESTRDFRHRSRELKVTNPNPSATSN